MRGKQANRKAPGTMMAERMARERGCVFCKTETELKWENYEKLAEYLTPRGRIQSSQLTGNCAKHQRLLSRVIKQARHLSLLPFTTQK